ncbi:MAG: hypothetical protein WCB49_13130, partial [Gammaproteobacteria bacterium]
MAKVNAPLLSFGGSGQVAKTQVYATWRGVKYVRRHVVPANPNTAGQQNTRSVFAFLSQMWKNAGTLVQEPWTAYALGQPLTNRNAFIGQNTKTLRPGTDMSAFIGSPGAKGGLAPLSIAITPGSGTLTVAFTNPAAPTGWAISSAVAMAMSDTDPHSSTDYATTAAEDAVTFNSVSLTGLTAGTYRVAAWLKWTKPN